ESVPARYSASAAAILAIVSDGCQTRGHCRAEPSLLFLAVAPGVCQGPPDLRFRELGEISFSERNGGEVGQTGARAELCRRHGNDGWAQTSAVPGNRAPPGSADRIAQISGRVFRGPEHDFSGNAAHRELSE